MKVIYTISDLQSNIKKLNIAPIGFVPTMGALHNGHLSLADTAIKLCPIIIVSIFVNPRQFNNIKDLKIYPRTIDNDLLILDKVLRENDIVFVPDCKEIYPEDNKTEPEFNFRNLDHVMEALHRPGHFNGVAQVVNRLFYIVEPDIAIFGKKDFQQLAVIKDLVRQTGNKVKIIGNPIIRETDGLAMSSRNLLLAPDLRKNAAVIYRTLISASEMISQNDIPYIKTFVEKTINHIPGFEVEYFEVADDIDLIPVKNKDKMDTFKQYIACIAVKAGDIRLIDNIEF
jgi:pantoate--beta-alanine ligase